MNSFWLLLAGLALSWGVAAASVSWLAADVGQLSLGHSGFLATGAYAFVLSVNAGVPWPFALALAGAVAGLLGAVVGLVAGPARGPLFSLLTLGFGLAAPRVALLISGWTGGSQGLVLQPLGWPATDGQRLVIALIVATALFAVQRSWQRGWLGASWRLQRDRPDVATTYGLSPRRLRSLAVALSAACTGVAGALLALFTGLVSPYDFGLATAFQLVVAAAAGGFGSLPGAMVAAAGLAALPFAVSFAVTGLRPEWLIVGQGALLLAAVSAPQWRRVRPGPGAVRPEPPSPAADAPWPAPDPGWAERAGVGGRSGELAVDGLVVQRSGVSVAPVTFTLGPGRAAVLRGDNGAGKSTLLAAVSGHLRARGRRLLNGIELSGLPPSDVARHGLVHVWQGGALGPALTVAEHLALARLAAMPWWRAAVPLSGPRWRRELKAAGDLDGPTARLAGQRGCTLSGGEAAFVQLLAAARLRPAVLVLDEPFAGMGSMYRPWVTAVLQRLRADGTALLVVDHLSGWVDGADEWRLHDGRLEGGTAPHRLVDGMAPARPDDDTAPAQTDLASVDRHGPAAPGRGAESFGREMLLDVQHLRSGYGRGPDAWPALSFSVAAGTVTGLTGPNGCGKSTLLHVLAGHLPRREGVLTWRGAPLPVGVQAHLRRGIVLVPQHRNVFPELTVAEQLQLAASASGWRGGIGGSRESAWRAIEHALALLPPVRRWLRRRVRELSGGQRQLVALARAVAMRPQLLLLDEPVAGLDAVARRLVAEAIAALRSDGVAIVIVEQQEAWLAGVADTVLAMTTSGLRDARVMMAAEVER